MKRKHLLGLHDVSRQEIEKILNNAAFMKKVIVSDHKRIPTLQGKSVVTLFYENSTRTRMSFELASKYMGAASANMSASASSVAKGETLVDTGATLDMMGVDVIIMRHPMSGAPHLLSQHVHASVVNAGDGMNEHPTQALLDMYTIQEKRGGLDGMKIAIIGDVLHSRVARSNAYGMKTMGADLYFAGPSTLMPPGFDRLGVHVGNDVRAAVENADVVMGLRIQRERQRAGLFPSVREYAHFFGIDMNVLKLAKKDALVMHPGPVNRGVELSSFAADCEQSVIREQVQNGVAVRMAVLDMLTRKEQTR